MAKEWSITNAYFQKAREMTNQGKHGPALEYYRAAVTEQPNNALILMETAIAYGNYGFWNDAAEYYKRAAVLDPDLVKNYPEFQLRLSGIAQEKDFDTTVKEAAEKPDISQIGLLIQGLNVQRDSTRAQVVSALCELKDPRAIQPILELIRQDKHDYKTIQDELTKFGEAIVEPLIQVLNDESDLQYIAIGTLGKIRDRRASQPLIDILPSIRPSRIPGIFEALGNIGDRETVEQLNPYLERDDFTKQYAALAVGRILGIEAIPLLETILESETGRTARDELSALIQELKSKNQPE